MVALLSNLNPLPNFPAYTGPYTVGSVDVEIPVSELGPALKPSASDPQINTIAFRIFYPCAPGGSKRPVRWIQSPQREIVNAYGRFLGAGSAMSSAMSYFSTFLYYTSIPVRRDAPLLTPRDATTQWPVTVFSRGLGSTRNTYSHFCGSLASHGVVVMALDHRDGSGPISFVRATNNTEKTEIDYRRIPHQPNKETYAARDEQIRIRLWELGMVHEALQKMNSGEAVENLAIHRGAKSKYANDANNLKMFKNSLAVSKPGSITFAGHSMGGATVVQFVKAVFYSTRGVDVSRIFDESMFSSSLKSQITPSTPVILLDPWGLPLNSPANSVLNSKPLPCFSSSSAPGGSAVLAILSEAFFNWRGNLNEIQRALRDPLSSTTNRPSARIFYPVKSAHLSQSDFGLLFPNITKYVAKADEPVRTMTLNVRATLQVMREAGIKVANTSRADMEVVGDEDVTKGDWKILSTEEGAVRGWISLSADDNGRPAGRNNVGEKHQLHNEAKAAGEGELKGALSP